MTIDQSNLSPEALDLKKRQFDLLKRSTIEKDDQQISGTPIFTQKVLDSVPDAFTQYGLLAGDAEMLDKLSSEQLLNGNHDPRLYVNVAAPSSIFICGSQGSGKSHTLSCLLESCLTKTDANELDNPLASMVFHYNTFSSDDGGMPCEAAYLSQGSDVKVRVFCAPTNIATIKKTYQGLNVSVEPLLIDEKHLNTQRMLDLMAVNPDNGPMPLYLHTINRILRNMRLEQQKAEVTKPFDYAKFKRLVEITDMTPAQKNPLIQRLETLESFMHKSQVKTSKSGSKSGNTKKKSKDNDWKLEAGTMTIIDLSCPCLTAEAACGFFNTCLGIFMAQKEKLGRVVALDEAHKYMAAGTEAATLTNSLLSAIRLQRHLGTRVLISTQEPTISPKLLALRSLTIVHRFTAPEWLRCLRAHLAALDDVTDESKTEMKKVPNEIVKLRVGEALLFGPSASIDAERAGGHLVIKRLGMDYLRIRVRSRVTQDGGKSQMAV